MRCDVVEPASLAEAVDILTRRGDAAVLAGGTDLLVRIKRGLASPSLIVSLRRIPGLDALAYEAKQGLKIGPLVTHAQTAADGTVRARFSALALACQSVGSPQIRNLASVAGNLANASPAADTAPALLALRAQLVLVGPRGTRRLALDRFFRGPGQTALEKGELIGEIFVPEPARGTRSTYHKLGRRKALEIAVCGVALAAAVRDGCFRNVSFGFGAVAPTPLWGPGAVLEGRIPSASLIEECAQVAAQSSSPIDDPRASAAYRRAMVQALVRRSIHELMSEGKEAGWC